MTAGGLQVRSPSGATAFSMAASRGQLRVVKALCWALYHKLGDSELAWSQVRRVINTPSGPRGAGCVDQALPSGRWPEALSPAQLAQLTFAWPSAQSRPSSGRPKRKKIDRQIVCVVDGHNVARVGDRRRPLPALEPKTALDWRGT